MLSKFLLVLAGLWLLFVLGRMIKLFFTCPKGGEKEVWHLFVLMGNQDHCAEGFLRKLISCRDERWPKLKVTVVDCGSTDCTEKIIRLLGKELNFSVIKNGSGLQKHEEGRLKDEFRLYYDARWKEGKNLIQAPLFSVLNSL